MPLATISRSTVAIGHKIFGATSPTPADAFIYSDGSHPDELHDDPPRIGWAAFFSESISGGEQVLYRVKHRGCGLGGVVPARGAVFMVELAGAVAALYTLAPRLRDRYVTMLIEAEVVEAALIRGYSSRLGVYFLADHSQPQQRNVRVQDPPHRHQPK